MDSFGSETGPVESGCEHSNAPLLYKYCCTLLEDDLKESVETCQIPSVLTVKILY
jgi:hypothetical protein